MPKPKVTRVYTVKGIIRSPTTTDHRKIQLATKFPQKQYAVIEFKVRPVDRDAANQTNGILTYGENDSVDPDGWDFQDQNEIAWSQYTATTAVPPGIGELPKQYFDEVYDSEHFFNYDLWLHTKTSTATDVNYIIRLLEIETDKEDASISSLRQILMANL